MLRAERNKHEAVSRQIEAIKAELFPRNGLQERVENFSTFYAKWGPHFIEALLQHSLGFEQQFTVLTENGNEAFKKVTAAIIVIGRQVQNRFSPFPFFHRYGFNLLKGFFSQHMCKVKQAVNNNTFLL